MQTEEEEEKQTEEEEEEEEKKERLNDLNCSIIDDSGQNRLRQLNG